MVEQVKQEVPILSRLHPPKGAVRARLRRGRGPGSGLGKTSGHGQKGQKARSGTKNLIGFEGGQMPLQRRLPKVGFYNPFSKKIATVNVGLLNRLQAGTVVDAEVLIRARLIQKDFDGIKILGQGELSRPLTVRANAFSASAKAKIENAGGTVEVIGAAKSEERTSE
ncbi:MAG: 50S ribosomal protein L15 [Deltaproteobacteria bacterium]|nr:50S ribosomal protein L15 [Deltaproteobacteria bacterium]